MNPRLAILFGLLGAVLATASVLGLRELGGWPAVLLGLLACWGSCVSALLVLAVTEVREEEGNRE